ncbi:MAG: MFS transporter [Verrucomicrobia bacterium]|nr:MFS transporter [Verrucomicrobiota bacterium]
MKSEPTHKSLATIWNMSFGFFGIQFGWGLQMGNMSAIYEYLGASESTLPLLWLAAPLTGLLVQPIIGHMSDRTWHPFWGRRRPYFLVGALLASLALFAMPKSSTLWMAAGLLWILDASVNISMEPFRAFVADLLPESQRTVGFAMQSVLIGAGAVLAAKLPGFLHDRCGIAQNTTPDHPIPETVHWAFTIGAGVFLLAVLWTVLTTRENPPTDEKAFAKKKDEGLSAIWQAMKEMPATMRQLAAVQFFTWMALFCMWIYFPVAVARNIMGATDTSTDLYKQGVQIANDCFAQYNFVAFLAAMGFLWLGRKMSARTIHFLSLLLGGAGLLSVGWLHDPKLLILAFTGVGVAWASILSMPYAMLSGAIPGDRMGVYMGIFNFFIVIPQILIALILSRVMEHFPSFNRLSAVIFGGICLLLASLLTWRVKQKAGAPNP